jgi:hypothetical protein
MTRVVVLLVIAAALIAQLALGTDPILVGLCGLALVVGFFPALVFRLDLYGILATIFAIRYVGAALITKTWLMQPLDQYLNAPVAAYGLSCLLMFVVVGVILTVRALDSGTTLFALPKNAEAVRLLGLVAFVIGTTAYAASGIIVSREENEAATGVYVLVVYLGTIHLLGFVAEVLYCALTNRSVFSRRLVVMLVVMFAIGIFLNTRSLMLDGVIAIAVSGIVYRVLRVRHLVGLAVVAVLASQIITPITMELRRVKYGKSAAEFASAAGEVITKAVSEPDYVGILRVRQAQEANDDNPLNLYDYYGEPTNVMNRFSYVALVDAVYFRAERQVPLGLSALDEIFSRVVPGFLVKKEPKAYGYGDWLSWELAIFPPPLKTFTNFGLPMEGYAVAGTLGFVLFPTLIMFPLLLVMSRVSSLRAPYPSSLVLFAALQWSIIEGTSDTYFVVLTRGVPILLVGLKMTEIIVYRFLLGSGPFALKPAANRLRGLVAGAPRPFDRGMLLP